MYFYLFFCCSNLLFTIETEYTTDNKQLNNAMPCRNNNDDSNEEDYWRMDVGFVGCEWPVHCVCSSKGEYLRSPFFLVHSKWSHNNVTRSLHTHTQVSPQQYPHLLTKRKIRGKGKPYPIFMILIIIISSYSSAITAYWSLISSFSQ